MRIPSRQLVTTAAAFTLVTPVVRAQTGARSAVVNAGASTVQVRCGADLGSGVIVGDRTLIATNEHVIRCVKRGGTAAVRPSGSAEWRSAAVRWSSDSLDLAVLQAVTPLGAPTPIRDGAKVMPTESVWAIGFPAGTFAGNSPSFVTGTISARATDADGRALYQHDAALNPGNSGGPLVDGCGRLIGVNVLRLRGLTGVNYAVPGSALAEPLASLGAPHALDTLPCSTAESPAREETRSPSAALLAGAGVLAGAALLALRRRATGRRAATASAAGAVEAVSGSMAGRRFPLDRGDVIIGRDGAECNVLYPDGDTTISRRHCTLTLQQDGRRVTLVDDGSSNGTFVRGTRLTAGVPATLEPGDHFSLGTDDERWRVVEVEQ